MDLVAWLWERVERRDAPALLAHALNTPTIRDALLREAAIRDGWSQLAHAAEDAAAAAAEVDWSRHSPDAVAAVCHWISAERTLRRIPAYDHAEPVAQAALAAWANPGDVAARLSASPPLIEEDTARFEDALHAEAAATAHAQLLEELDIRISTDPDFAVRVLDDRTVSRLLLRHAARTGNWKHLAEAAERAVTSVDPGQPNSAGPGSVWDICRWMLGEQANCPDPRWTHPHEMAEALAYGPPMGESEAARLRDLMT